MHPDHRDTRAAGRAGRSLRVGHVDFDGILLTDTIQSADTLFQQIRVERQIEQHQMAGKLEVTPF